MNEIPAELIPLLIPIVLIEIGLIVAALWDLSRPGRRVRGGSRAVWALVILLASTIGPILYFVVGREEAGPTDDGATPTSPTAAPGWIPPDAPAGPDATWEARPPTDGRPAIECRGLAKRYGGAGGVLALDRLDLAVPAGSVFGLLGPNGAGKTTTLRILAGLTHRTAGEASVTGENVGPDATRVARHIGFLEQDPRFYGWMTGRETVDLVARLHGVDGTERSDWTREALGRVGLADAADRRVATYSGGMRQRLGIAQALVNHPPVLILDEPVSSLDPEGRRDLLELIAGLRGSTTVLFSTHVLSDVERVCDRVAILDHGRLVVEGPLDELLERYARPIFRLDPEPGQAGAVARLLDGLRSRDWVIDAAMEHGYVRVTVADTGRASAELLPAVVEAGVALTAYERVRPTLEDVFLQLVGRDGEASS